MYLHSNEVGNGSGLERVRFLSVTVAVPLPLSTSPSPLLLLVSPLCSHSHMETCRCLVVPLPCSVSLPRRCLASPLPCLCRCLASLHIVLCELNEPYSQSFRVGAQVCSECVNILILSSIFKHCINLKKSLVGGASVIGNFTTQVNL
jgi:hypothetical protein